MEMKVIIKTLGDSSAMDILYYMSMKDKHHGVWNIHTYESSGKVILDLKWSSIEGHAQFEKVDPNNFK